MPSVPLRWRPELWLDLRARGCQARLIGAGWRERSLAAASGSGRGAAALGAALSALRLADVDVLPGQARLRVADEYLLHLLLHHDGSRAQVRQEAQQRFRAVLGDGARHLMLLPMGRQRWLASALEAADLATWTETLQHAGLRAGRIEPLLHAEWQRVGRQIRDADAVLVLPRDEGATLLRLIDGEPVDLAWERFDSEDSASLERRVRAFARLPQGRSRRPTWAQTGSGGSLAETDDAQVIYLLPESGTLCRYVRERSGSGGGADGLAG
jgi:hypothetical protein